MNLDIFLDELLGRLVADDCLKDVKKLIAAGMKEKTKNYDSCTVECTVYEEYGDEYPTATTVTHEAYSEGDIVFIDQRIM